MILPALPPDGTPERRDVPQRVPADELVRVREAIYAQYYACTLPTLEKSLEYLETPTEGVDGDGDCRSTASVGRGGGGGDGDASVAAVRTADEPDVAGGRAGASAGGGRKEGAPASMDTFVTEGFGDYHSKMTSKSWLQWHEETFLPKIRDGVLVIDRAPYHFVQNEATRPVNCKARKAVIADWPERHDEVPAACVARSINRIAWVPRARVRPRRKM